MIERVVFLDERERRGTGDAQVDRQLCCACNHVLHFAWVEQEHDCERSAGGAGECKHALISSNVRSARKRVSACVRACVRACARQGVRACAVLVRVSVAACQIWCICEYLRQPVRDHALLSLHICDLHLRVSWRKRLRMQLHSAWRACLGADLVRKPRQMMKNKAASARQEASAPALVLCVRR